ncbi:MAG: hypothetical protein GPJ54_12355 [Candidatus Heimdallarchaeota archaeon]|nr:hypothetical protein [Candidatus Heimdallarchaeota archaeon]
MEKLDSDYYDYSIDLLINKERLIFEETIKKPIGKMKKSILKFSFFVFLPLSFIIGNIFSRDIFSSHSYLLRSLFFISLITISMYYVISYKLKQEVIIYRIAWMEFLYDQSVINTKEIDDDDLLIMIEKYVTAHS